MGTRTPKRKRLVVTQDEDYGITVIDPQSGLRLSIIATHPSAAKPYGVFVEVYPGEPGHEIVVLPASVDTAKVITVDTKQSLRHPTLAFYGHKLAEADKA